MSVNIAGIVPIAGLESDIDLPWPHVLMPYEKNKTLLQNAVYTCAMAGCKSIWIICNHDIQPIVKKIVGDSIEDPVYRFRSHARYASEHKKHIPIFYAPLPLRDMRKRDNVAWSAIFGCALSVKIFGQISTYTAPDKFFVAWPCAVLENANLREHRKAISAEDLIIASEGKDLFTNDFLPFCFGRTQLEALEEHCYRLNNPYVDAKAFEDLTLSEIFLPLAQNSRLEVNLGYKKVACWEDYCSIFK